MIKKGAFLFFILVYSSPFWAQTGTNQQIDSLFKESKNQRRIDLTVSLRLAQEALHLSQISFNKKKEARALTEVGSAFMRVHKMDSAAYYFSQAKPIFAELNDLVSSGILMSKFSTLAKMNGDMANAFKYLVEAEAFFRKGNKTNLMLAVSVNLGYLLTEQNQHEEALVYFKKAEAGLDPKDAKNRSVVYMNMSGAYLELRDYENAYKYIYKAIDLKEKINDVDGLNKAKNNLAAIKFQEKGAQDDETISLLENALIGHKKSNNYLDMLKVYNNLGEIYRLRKEYPKALTYLKLGESIASRVQSLASRSINEEELSRYYEEIGDWKQSVEHFKKHEALKDSLYESDKLKAIQEYQIKYQVDEVKREQDLAETKQKLAEAEIIDQRNRSYLIYALIGFVGIVLLFIYFQVAQKRKRELLQVKLAATEKKLALEEEARKQEIKALTSQMNPHFIFNSLNSIQDLILQGDTRNSTKYLGKFGDLTRKVLKNSNQNSISVQEELTLIQLYADLEHLRFGDDLTFLIQNNLTEEETEELLIPVMFIQPYIENAFKHGLIHQKGKKELTLTVEHTENRLLFAIDDNGIGRKAAEVIKERRQGQNLNFSHQANEKRADLMQKGQNDDVEVKIIDKFQEQEAIGTRVEIYFKLNREFEDD